MSRGIKKQLKRFHAEEAGQLLVLMAAGMVAMIGVVALSVDVGFLYWQKRNLQSLADASALAGAQRANWDYDNPAILNPEGPNDAQTYAELNGATAEDTLIINFPPANDGDDPTDDADPWNGDARYIEVRITRPAETFFARIFGIDTVDIYASAVARTIRPGTGNFALLVLDGSGVTFDTNGTAPCVNVYGDIYSYGGITVDGNGLCMNSSSVWSLNGTITQNPAGNIVDALYICDNDPDDPTCPQVPLMTNPYATWMPPYPNPSDDNEFTSPLGGYHNIPCIAGNDCTEIDALADPPSRYGPIKVRANGNAWLGTGLPMTTPPDNGPGNAVFTDLLIRNNGYATFVPGTYKIDGDVDINSGGTLELEPGVYWITGNLTVKGILISGNSCSAGEGALIILDGLLDVGGSGQFTLYGDPNYDYVALYATNDKIDLAGTGDRMVEGTVYAPTSEVELSGDADGSTIRTCPDGGGGQLIAWRATLNGGSPAISGPPPGSGFVFSPALVNKPTVP